MKTTLTILLAVLIVACKKTVNTPANNTPHEKHGLVSVTINSNFQYPLVDIYRYNCFMNADGSGKNVPTEYVFWNNGESKYKHPITINYTINSKDTGSYFIHATAHKLPRDTNLYMNDNKKVWLSIKAVDQYGVVLMDSTSSVNTDMTCVFKVR